MSQILRRQLVSIVFKNRSLTKIFPTETILKLDSRCFVTNSMLFNYNKLSEKSQQTEKKEYFSNSVSDLNLNNKKSYNQFNQAKNLKNKRFNDKYEQIGMEDAEPVEYNNKNLQYASENEFDKYDLNADFLNHLKELGYKKPFEIQEKTLDYTLGGRDLVGKAFTGSGKTLAFAIPIINKILNCQNLMSPYPKCLILSPTRELCLQLTRCFQELAPNLRCLAIYGGSDYESQIRPLRRGIDIICATPGRLNDLINRNYFVTKEIETICLDEADELLTPNFELQIKDVIQMSNTKQMMMFSATINKNVVKLIRQYMKDPKFVDLTEGQKFKLPTNIDHCVIRYNRNNHAELIKHYLNEYKSDRCIVFTNTKIDAKVLNEDLYDIGIKSNDLHSDHSQNKRARILGDFRKGKTNVLVATDVAARGLDIQEVNLVVQIGFPMSGVEYYIHRSGRCGRAGRIGTSIMVLNSHEKIDRELIRLVKLTELDIPAYIQDSNDFDSRTILKENFDSNRRNEAYLQNKKHKKRFHSNDISMGKFGSHNIHETFGNQKHYKKSYQQNSFIRFKNDDDY